MHTFNVCDSKIKDIKNISHIHPRKQREVASIIRNLKPYAKSIKVFGSATRWDCNEKSDIDFVVTKEDEVKDLRGLYKLIQEKTNYRCDLLCIDNIEKQMSKYQKENIIDKGVIFYAE